MTTYYRGYRVTSPYGNRTHPITRKPEFHKGIDLVIAHQSPIKAFVGGTVVHAKVGISGSGFGNYGNVVAIKGKDGYITMYAHLHAVKVKTGQVVTAGTVIGTQGNTGASAGSHLHFEVRSKSTPSFGYGTHVNPVTYLDKVLAPKPVVQPAVYHIVKSGDTVSALAVKYKTTIANIKALNKLDSKYTIRLGQKLRVK